MTSWFSVLGWIHYCMERKAIFSNIDFLLTSISDKAPIALEEKVAILQFWSDVVGNHFVALTMDDNSEVSRETDMFFYDWDRALFCLIWDRVDWSIGGWVGKDLTFCFVFSLFLVPNVPHQRKHNKQTSHYGNPTMPKKIFFEVSHSRFSKEIYAQIAYK